MRKPKCSSNVDGTWHAPLRSAQGRVSVFRPTKLMMATRRLIQKAKEKVVLGQRVRRPNTRYPKEMWYS